MSVDSNAPEKNAELPRLNKPTGNEVSDERHQQLKAELAGRAVEVPAISKQQTTSIPPASDAPVAPPPMTSHTDNTATPVPALTLPQIADDSDLIETEWVNKAREIVDKNRQDPRMQNTELSKVKAAYIKKRYNKDLKVAEE